MIEEGYADLIALCRPFIRSRIWSIGCEIASSPAPLYFLQSMPGPARNEAIACRFLAEGQTLARA